MKVLKGFFLVIIVIILLFTLLAAEVQFLLQKTVLEPGYFRRMYRANDMEEALAEIIENQIGMMTSEALLSGEGESVDIRIDTEEYVDVEWLAEEIGDFVNGSYKYFTGGDDDLPEIDLVPVKEMMYELTVDQMLEHGDIEGSLGQLNELIAAYDEKAGNVPEGEADMAAIESLASESEAMGLSADMLEVIITTYKSLDENMSEENKAKAVAAAVVGAQMGLDEMADELDINDIIDEMYPDGDNPLEAVRSIILAVKNTLFYALISVLVLLILIVVFTAFRPASIFGWLSVPLIMGGLFSVGIWVVGWILPALGGFAQAFESEIFDGVHNVTAFAEGYLRGIFNFALIQGLIILGTGIIFTILAGVFSGISRRKHSPAEEKHGSKAALMAFRVIIVVVLVFAMFFVTANYYLEIYDDISDAAEILEKARSETGFMEAVAESADIPFFAGLGGE